MDENYIDEARGIEAEYHADLAAERERTDKAEAELAKLEQLANGWILKNNASWQGESDLPAFFEARLNQLAIAGRAMLDAEQKVARLEEVLRWYADPENYQIQVGKNPPVPYDYGRRAQEVLEGNNSHD